LEGRRAGLRIEWFERAVSSKIKTTVKQNVQLATHYLMTKVVRNIGTPVTKLTGPRGGRVITNRSKSGEYPHADTTMLQKSIYSQVIQSPDGSWKGMVGTPLDYGLLLELKMNRSFLVRTLHEEESSIRRLLSRSVKA